jgi:tRNA pseudouridine55 synthase
VGEQMQVPPAYSAKRSGGERLYDLARRGVAVERVPVRVVVYALDLRSVEGAEVEMEVRCAAGTYVRAIARDLGERLGTGAHLVALRRIRSGTFGRKRRWAGTTCPSAAAKRWFHGGAAPDLPAVTVTDEGERALRFGRDLARALVGVPGPAGPRVARRTGRERCRPGQPARDGRRKGAALDPVLHPDIVLLETAAAAA